MVESRPATPTFFSARQTVFFAPVLKTNQDGLGSTVQESGAMCAP